MSNMRLSWPNRFADAAITGATGDWATNLPPSNLQTRAIAQVARSAGAAAAALFVDTGAAVPVGVFAAVGHNLTTAADVRLRGYTADPRGTTWFDLGPSGVQSGATVYGGEGTGGTGYPGTYWGGDGLLKISGGGGRFTHTFSTGGACLGLLLEPERTNVVLHSRDGTQSAWTKSNATATKTATGLDGTANSATRLTATGSNGSMLQSITTPSSTNRFSIYARRVSGSSQISLSVGGSGTNITLTTAWARFDVTHSGTGGSVSVGIQIATSGDVIEVDCAQYEVGAYASSPIITTTASLTRTADQFSLTVASHSAGTLLVRGQRAQASTVDEPLIDFGDLLNTGHGILSTAAGNFAAYSENSGASQWNLGASSSSTRRTFCVSYAANNIIVSVDGAAAVTDGSATITAQTVLESLATRTGTYYLSLVAWWNAASSSADVVALSGTLSRAAADYDSTATDAWPAAWVSGTTAEQRAGVVGCSVIVPSPEQTYRYWRVDLIDAANPDGYIEVGRLFGGSAWSPAYNAVYGASIGYEDRDVIAEMDSGSEYVRKRNAPRVTQFALPALSDSETLLTVLEMQRRLGSTGEVLYEFDPADTTYAPMRRYLARLRKVSPLKAAFLDRWEAEFEARELL
jgi:hypothetical protein